MLLHLIGINHYDPLGRGRLVECLTSLAMQHGAPPIFVAVEWDPMYFAQVKQQRPAFRNLARDELKVERNVVLDALELSLGYEGDAHRDVFPNVDTLWLDQGRQAGFITPYAQRRAGIYKSYLKHHSEVDEESILNTLSLEAWQASDKAGHNLGDWDYRDELWLERVGSRLAGDPGEWAILIVGAGHTEEKPDRLGQMPLYALLVGAGHPCTRRILSPERGSA